MSKLTKKEVRKLAEKYKISVANRPPSPCLATRFPYGTFLSYDKMRNVESGEEYIKSLGFYNVRLRINNNITRIEVDDREMDKLLLYRRDIISELKSLGYEYITIDLEGFRLGSMDYEMQLSNNDVFNV